MTITKSETSLRTRAGDKTFLDTPDLRKNKANMPFIVAACNGAVEKDVTTSREKIICLNNLFKEYDLNQEAKEHILPFLLKIEILLEKQLPNKYAVIKCLLEHGAKDGFLLWAQKLDLEMLRALFDYGIDPNKNHKGFSALHAAITSMDHFGWRTLIDYLLSKGVDPNNNEETNGTVLHVILANESFDNTTPHVRAKYLISLLPKYNYDWNIQDKEGKTVLIIAAKMRATEILKILIELKERQHISIDLNKQDKKGRTALHFCSALGDAEGVKLLINAGASHNICDNEGRTALAYAKLNEKVVRCILKEIHIDPDRDEKALNNYLVGLNNQPIYCMDGNNKQIYAKSQKEIADILLPKVLAQMEQQQYPSVAVKEYDFGYIKIQCRLSGKLLIESCLEGQKKVLSFLSTLYENKTLISNQKLTLLSSQQTNKNYQELINQAKKHIEKFSDDTPFLQSICNKEFSKALRQACAANRSNLVEILLNYLLTQQEADITDCMTMRSETGKNALQWAASSANKSSDLTIVKLLWEHGGKKMRDEFIKYLNEENVSKLQQMNNTI